MHAYIFYKFILKFTRLRQKKSIENIRKTIIGNFVSSKTNKRKSNKKKDRITIWATFQH